jgi:hypothetical protein
VQIGLTDSNSSCLIDVPGTTQTRYVVMPIEVNLSDRTTPPDQRRGRILSCARGAEPPTRHGPLQRLLYGHFTWTLTRVSKNRRFQRSNALLLSEKNDVDHYPKSTYEKEEVMLRRRDRRAARESTVPE